MTEPKKAIRRVRRVMPTVEDMKLSDTWRQILF